MGTKYSLDTIYNYTESLIKAQEESLNRLDSKSSTFIGFSGVLIRLALDLPNNKIKTAVCIFALITIGISSLGLTCKSTGETLTPTDLRNHYEQKWMDNDYSEYYCKAAIVNIVILIKTVTKR